MHILIVDDEPLARQRLERLIDQMPNCEVVGTAGNGAEAMAAIGNCDPDLVLLDVRMPHEDGLQVANNIAKMQEPPAIVFCTAYDEYALQAFDTLAVGYLLKPVEAEALASVLEKASKTNKVQRLAVLEAKASPEIEQRQHISAKTHRGMELIALSQVYFFQADQKYVTVIHKDGETLIDDTLKELEQQLEGRFVRVHRNALVAIDEIEGLEREAQSGCYELRLKNTAKRPLVSRRHVTELRSLLARL